MRLRLACADMITFISELRAAAVAGYRYRYGLVAALPVTWACVDAYLCPGIAYAGFLGMALFLEPRPGCRLACLGFFFVVLSLAFGRFAEAEPKPFPADAAFIVEGTVRGFPSRQIFTSFTLETAWGGYRVRTRDPACDPLPGQRVRLRARLQPVQGPTNPGQFDYPALLRSQNLRGILLAETFAVLAEPGAWDRLIIKVRGTLSRALDRFIPAGQSSLVKAALLGDTDGLDPGVVDDFKASGMLHILAISGQHVGILALILLQVFALMRLPRKAAYLATGALLAVYVPVCGNAISVFRAAIMFWSGLPPILWERPGAALNNLGWAMVVCLGAMPWTLLSLGFQLSFAATYLLILYSRPMAAMLLRLKVRGALSLYLVSTPALSLILFLGAYPLLAAVSHTSSPFSILGNVATIGISSGMLVAACLALLASPIAGLAACFGAASGALGALLAYCVHGLARAPGAALPAAALSIPWSLALIALVLAFPCAARTGRGASLILLGLLAFAGRWAWISAATARAPARVDFLDVGQGDGAVCRLPGAVVLIDAGPEPAGREVILPFLRSRGIGRIDLVIITHPDLDHYGGLAYVADRMDIGRVLYPGLDADTHAWSALKATLSRRGIPLDTALRGQTLFAGGGCSLRVLSPELPAQYADRNDNSVVTLLGTPAGRILFTGDLGPEAEMRLLQMEPARLRGAILKVPHHGSDLSNPAAFLAAVHPEFALLSAGRTNKFGHPGPVTVATLRGMGSRILLTARDGAIGLECMGPDASTARPAAWTRFLAADTSAPIKAPPRPSRRRRAAGRSSHGRE